MRNFRHLNLYFIVNVFRFMNILNDWHQHQLSYISLHVKFHGVFASKRSFMHLKLTRKDIANKFIHASLTKFCCEKKFICLVIRFRRCGWEKIKWIESALLFIDCDCDCKREDVLYLYSHFHSAEARRTTIQIYDSSNIATVCLLLECILMPNMEELANSMQNETLRMESVILK